MHSTKWPPHGDKKKLKGEDVSQLSLVQHYLPYFLEVLTETGLIRGVWGGWGSLCGGGRYAGCGGGVEVGCVRGGSRLGVEGCACSM